MDSARNVSLCDASVRGVCVCLCLCGSVIACEISMYACISVSQPLRWSAGRYGTSAGKFEEDLFCVPERECVVQGLVLAPSLEITSVPENIWGKRGWFPFYIASWVCGEDPVPLSRVRLKNPTITNRSPKD